MSVILAKLEQETLPSTSLTHVCSHADHRHGKTKLTISSQESMHTYFIHAILFNTEFPSIAMRSFWSCFKLLFFEVLVFLEHILSQLMNTLKTDN